MDCVCPGGDPTGLCFTSVHHIRRTGFIVNLVIYFAGFVVCWGITSCAICLDTAGNVTTEVLRGRWREFCQSAGALSLHRC